MLLPSNIKFLVGHCSYTPPSMLIGEKEIEDWHVNQGWRECGYHVVIRRDKNDIGSYIDLGRTFEEVGAHVGKKHNPYSYGFCLIGGKKQKEDEPECNFTQQQMEIFFKVLHYWKLLFPKAEITGHYSFSPKTCPTFNVENWWEQANMSFKNLGKVPLPVECVK